MWIGVDLDGTLAEYHGWEGKTHIGAPIPRMVKRIHQWRGEGYEVRIFTARAGDPESERAITAWLKQHKLPPMRVTNVKDYAMVFLVDDRAKQVIPNTGLLLEENIPLPKEVDGA